MMQEFESDARNVLILDLGTNSVRAMIARVTHNDGTVLGVGNEQFDMREIQNGVIVDIARVIERCLNAIKTAQKQAGKEPHVCLIGFSGESMKGQTINIDYTREHPREEITLSELKHIIHQVQWSAFDSIRKRFAEETGHLEVDIKLISASVEHINIDGQFIRNPIGFRGKKMEIDVYNCFAPLLHYGALQTIGAEIPYPVLDIVVQPYALSHALLDKGDTSCIILDVGAGTTDVALVENGLKETKSFAIAGRAFTKRIAFELNISFDEAERVKFAYGEGKLDLNSSRIVKEILDRDAKTWLMGLKICLEEMNVTKLPSQIILTGGGSLLTEIEELLRSTKWHVDLPFENFPSFTYLTPGDIPSVKDPKKLLSGPQHSGLVALAVLSRELIGKDLQVAGILRKIVQVER
jgi:cell division protein FtsA